MNHVRLWVNEQQLPIRDTGREPLPLQFECPPGWNRLRQRGDGVGWARKPDLVIRDPTDVLWRICQSATPQRHAAERVALRTFVPPCLLPPSPALGKFPMMSGLHGGLSHLGHGCSSEQCG